MTDRLDRLEQTCASNAEAIRLMITEMVPAIRLDAERTSELTKRADTRSAENEQRFSNLLEEAREDRKKADEDRKKADAEREENKQRFSNLLGEAREDRKLSDQRWEQLQAKADADREESARRFDEQMAQIRALSEQNRALLSALASTNGRVDSLEQAG